MLASLARPPIAEITRGVNEPRSTSLILCSYARFFICCSRMRVGTVEVLSSARAGASRTTSTI